MDVVQVSNIFFKITNYVPNLNDKREFWSKDGVKLDCGYFDPHFCKIHTQIQLLEFFDAKEYVLV
jgi:hypothetical protein